MLVLLGACSGDGGKTSPTPVQPPPESTGTVLAIARDPRGIAARAGDAYWIETSGEPVKKAPASGGPPVSMMHPMKRVTGAAVAGHFLYYLDYRDGAFSGSGCLGSPPGAAAIVRVSPD